MPIAEPRRSGGNQPTTTRPLAELVQAPPMPPRSRKIPIHTYEVLMAAAVEAAVRRARPIVIEVRSPMRSTICATAARPALPPLEGHTFEGYRNADGSVGTRNLLAITTTVQCVAGGLEFAVERIRKDLLPKYPNVDGVVGLSHSYGCGVAIDAPAELLAEPCPPLMLISLAENAVKHGAEPKIGPVQVTLTARRSAGGGLDLTVADDGAGFGSQATGTGLGLANIRDRLQQIYQGRAELTLNAGPAGGVVATLHLPPEPAA